METDGQKKRFYASPAEHVICVRTLACLARVRELWRETVQRPDWEETHCDVFYLHFRLLAQRARGSENKRPRPLLRDRTFWCIL